MARRAIRTVVSMLVAAASAAACTQDFDVFEGPADTGTAEGGSSDDGAATPADGSPPGSDAGKPDGETCASAFGSCAKQREDCREGCYTTSLSCLMACPGGGSGRDCRDKCRSDRDACLAACNTACETCTGAACTSICD